MRIKLLSIVFVFVSFLVTQRAFSEETITITTYYPSPYGSYKELRSQRMAVGDNYYNAASYCWAGTCTTTVDSNADLIVEGRVGLGTASPQNPLDVEGGMVVGATYSGTNTAPANGALIEGNVGIGKTTAATALDVNGTVTAGTVNATSSYQANGTAGLASQTLTVVKTATGATTCTVTIREGIVTASTC